ncbi:dihydrolipoamide acetyltransferase family protein [Nocardioides sp. R-C-SC26]|uniref:dihydrolipoamide acetyltransferase family protein n=1 Tax=Nocardioides sp. R-C-SC26 TaxID=2870414 RepID=UPI001E45A4DA|nr:dihydrolipoamide acetyltransferase family protein [Nocardioides sp. R-C-SC26]
MPHYLLPDVGEGLTEAEIVTWKVKIGDVIAVNDVVVEIETAKSLVELPSPYAGEVTALLVGEGQTVEVGTPIITVSEVGADASVPPASDSPMDLSNPAATGGAEGEILVGRAKAEGGTTRRPRRTSAPVVPLVAVSSVVEERAPVVSPVVEERAPVVSPVVEERAPASVSRPREVADGLDRSPSLAKPPVRKLAKERGIDLRDLVGTGPGGLVTREDVLAPADLSARADASAAEETREPVKGVRKAMAAAMVSSAFTAPHVSIWTTVDVSATTELVARWQQRREFADLKVSPLLVVAVASMRAMRRTPIINSWWDDAAQEVAVRHRVNLGIAAATPRGLVVPNVRDADRLGVVELARAFADLTASAREGRTPPSAMSGGTFTITNIGVFGIDGGTPIINPGESAILCAGAISRQPWVVTEHGEERLAVRDVMTLSLSFDHRHIDGEAGSRYLADVAGVLADPTSALLF